MSEEIRRAAADIRIAILRLCQQAHTGHVGSAFSIVEILLALYSEVIKGRYPDPDRDRVILGKGHACTALYSTLFKFGRMDEARLRGYSVNGSRIGHHPHYEPAIGLEANTGSLGHGLSIGAGLAYAARLQDSPSRTFVILSDGDTNEGSTWEAAAFAAHHKLSSLCMILDANEMQALGLTRDILWCGEYVDRWASVGWDVIEVNGHDVGQLTQVLSSLGAREKPLAVIADTVKGQGVTFMENSLLWHYRPPVGDELARAIEQLSR